MKYLIVLVACLASAGALLHTDGQEFETRNYTLACMKQVGIAEEQEGALYEINLKKAHGKVKCFFNCFLEKAGFVADGDFKPIVKQILRFRFGVDKINAIQAKCNSVKGADKCDTTFSLYMCYLDSLLN